MVDADKTDIHSIKVLGEGAFGIVDLVIVETPKAPLLCVRKKLLKQVGSMRGSNCEACVNQQDY